MYKKMFVCSSLVLMLTGCNQKEELTTEQHKITSIQGNEIHGELLKGSGEGIFYTKQDFKEKGIENIKVGDVVNISWTTENYNNEEWTIHSIENIK